MTSTIDFTKLDDQDLLYGYQRVNRQRFPDNFRSCAEEADRRGLNLPEKFEVEALRAESALALLQKLQSSLSAVASILRPSDSGQIETPDDKAETTDKTI